MGKLLNFEVPKPAIRRIVKRHLAGSTDYKIAEAEARDVKVVRSVIRTAHDVRERQVTYLLTVIPRGCLPDEIRAEAAAIEADTWTEFRDREWKQKAA